MTDAPHDLDFEPLILPPERVTRRQDAAHETMVMLLRVQHEEGLSNVEDAARGAMAGIGEVLASLEGGNAFMVELCTRFASIARTLRDRPPVSRGLQ